MLRLRSVLPALLAACASAPRDGAGRNPGADGDAVRRILRESLANGRADELLAELCATAPHRLAGSPGASRAIAWAEEAMRRAGLDEVALEPCLVPRWERGSAAELRLLDPPEGAGETLPILALGNSVGTPAAGLEGEVVEVRTFEELRALGDRARGKLVFFNRPFDAGMADTFAAYGAAVNQRWSGAVEAAKAGGIAAIVRSMTPRIDDHPHTGSMGYADGVPKVPAAAVSTRGAERLSALVRSGSIVRARLRLGCLDFGEVPSHNVVGELRGRERPDEIVLVGAHLDAWDVGQGAHDDGAGCAQSIEAVRLLATLGLRPRRTIRVVLFTNEENGLRGARAYRDAHAAELDAHVFALESDRGGFAPRGFTTNANPDALAALRSLARPLAEAGAGDVAPGDGGADIAPLAEAGVVLAGLLPDPQRYFDFHHCALDTIDAVHPRELNLGAGAMAALLYGVAELPEPLPRNAPAR